MKAVLSLTLTAVATLGLAGCCGDEFSTARHTATPAVPETESGVTIGRDPCYQPS
jgi:hypothetical protein